MLETEGHRVVKPRAAAAPYNEEIAKGDLQMAHLTESAGWAPFRSEIIRRQGELTGKLLSAPARQEPLHVIYGLIGEINALARTLGIPDDLTKRAQIERKKVQDPRQEDEG